MPRRSLFVDLVFVCVFFHFIILYQARSHYMLPGAGGDTKQDEHGGAHDAPSQLVLRPRRWTPYGLAAAVPPFTPLRHAPSEASGEGGRQPQTFWPHHMSRMGSSDASVLPRRRPVAAAHAKHLKTRFSAACSFPPTPGRIWCGSTATRGGRVWTSGTSSALRPRRCVRLLQRRRQRRLRMERRASRERGEVSTRAFLRPTRPTHPTHPGSTFWLISCIDTT